MADTSKRAARKYPSPYKKADSVRDFSRGVKSSGNLGRPTISASRGASFSNGVNPARGPRAPFGSAKASFGSARSPYAGSKPAFGSAKPPYSPRGPVLDARPFGPRPHMASTGAPRRFEERSASGRPPYVGGKPPFGSAKPPYANLKPPYVPRAPQARSNSAPGAKSEAPTSWSGVADWYHNLVEDESSYQKQVVLPNLLRILDIKPGERVLDMACGDGSFAREFARIGAHVTGADISSELIEIAKEQGLRNIRYEVAPADNLPFVPNNSINTITITLALQNIDDLNAVFDECTRVLQPGGRMVCVINHPAFRIPKESSWGWDERERTLYRRMDRYLSESRALIQMHPGENPDEVTASFHRPLQVYMKALNRAGFAVKRLEEWISNRKSQPGPRAVAEDKARKEFPLFMCFEAVKLEGSSE